MIPGLSAAESIQAWFPIPPQLFPVVVCVVLLVIVSIMKGTRRPRQPSVTSQGSAKWSTKRDFKEVGAVNTTGFYLGAAFGTYLRSPRQMSVVVFGPPGAGKTVTNFRTSMMDCDDDDIVCVVQDEELIEQTAPHRRTLGPVYVLDFADPLSPDQLNFRDLIRWNTPYAFGDCQRQAEQIVRLHETSGSLGAQHYGRVATAMIPLSMRYLYEIKPDWTYEDLLDFYSTPGQTPKTIVQAMAKSSSKTLQRGAARLMNQGLAEVKKDFSAAAEWFTLWEDPILARTTSRTTIPWDAFQQGPKDVRQTLLIRTSSDDAGGRHAHVFSLLLDQLLFLKTNRRSTDYTRELKMLVDDARFLGPLTIWEVIASSKRKYGIRLMLTYHSPAQLWELYGRYGTGLLNGCGCWVIYPQFDPDAAEYLAKKCGEATVIEPMDRVSHRGVFGQTTSAAVQARQRKLMTGEEIMSLGKEGKILICVGPEKVIGERIDARRW